jgi:hypothetical protein
MDAEEIDAWNPDNNDKDKKMLELDLYDGINFIGSFKFDWNDIEELTLETEDERGTVFSVSGMKEGIISKNKLGIGLDFPLPTHQSSGECYIYEYDDEEKEEETTTFQAQEVTSSIGQRDDEDEKMKQKRMKRIGVFVFIGTIIALTWTFLTKEYPEVINGVINLFR